MSTNSFKIRNRISIIPVDVSTLSNQELGDVYFDSVTNRPVIWNGSIWKPIPSIHPLTSLGDILTHDGSSIVRQPLGSNTHILRANSVTSTGLEWVLPIDSEKINPNFVINGNFDHWQRTLLAAVVTNAGGNFYSNVDRFMFLCLGSGASLTSERLIEANIEPILKTASRGVRLTRNATAASDTSLRHIVENGRRLLAGKSFTLSFYVRCTSHVNAQFSITHNDADIENYTLPNQNQLYKITYTKSLSSVATGNIRLDILRGMAANHVYEIFQVKLEEGPIATEFIHAGGCHYEDGRLCQRYFEKSFRRDTNVGAAGAQGHISQACGPDFTTTNLATSQFFQFQTQKAVNPTVTMYDISGQVNRVSRLNANSTITDGVTAYSVSEVGPSGFLIVGTENIARNGIRFHFTAESELY